MSPSKTFFLAGLLLFSLGCSSTKNVTGSIGEFSASALQPVGRYQVNQAQDLELISSAAHVGFRFTGRQAQVVAAASYAGGHGYLQYELDGRYQKRVRVSGLQDTLTITAPTAGKHTVWLYKTTEAHTGPVILKKILGQEVVPVSKPAAPFIEFIGNSITSGAAADPSEVACGTGQYHDQHNAYHAYGPRVARALNANFVLSSVSGIGAYRNWNSNGPTMPEVYEKVDFRATNPQKWDFNKMKPAVVSIALGTNDFSEGDGKKERLPFDSVQFINEYAAFVKDVKTKYPQARIALLSSAMVNGKNRKTLENSLTAIKAQIDAAYPTAKPVALYFFKPMQPTGCSGHPNVEEHGVLAEELTPFFKKLLE